MDTYFKKASIKRSKEWRGIELEDEIKELQPQNLNQTRGQYIDNQSIYTSNDIRKYNKKGMYRVKRVISLETQSILQKTVFPLLRSRIYPKWIVTDRGWLTHHYLRSVVQTPSVINTAFPLTSTNRNQLQEIRIVNTRTADMEFSSSSNLAIACNCIKGGYLSIIKASSLASNEPSLHSDYNNSLSQPTHFYYKVFFY